MTLFISKSNCFWRVVPCNLPVCVSLGAVGWLYLCAVYHQRCWCRDSFDPPLKLPARYHAQSSRSWDVFNVDPRADPTRNECGCCGWDWFDVWVYRCLGDLCNGLSDWYWFVVLDGKEYSSRCGGNKAIARIDYD